VAEERVRFDTEVPGIWGLRPATPLLWSFSSLKEIEACPRRWMLSRADYPDMWARHGYPSLPVVTAIFGNVVHGVVERLIKELGAAGISSPSAGDVVGLLGSLGGWRGIVLDSIDQSLRSFTRNPRVSSDRLERIRDELVRRAPEAADQVKAFFGRGALPAAKGSSTHHATESAPGPKRRYPAGLGAHAELEVTADELRLTGRIDLLCIDEADVTGTDFKTGAEDAGHDDQVRLYALLWDLDRQINPDRRPATQLVVAYPFLERVVEAPDAAQLRVLETTTAKRVEAADSATQDTPPTATPSKETCQFCHVKHLCDAYWPVIPPGITEASPEVWFDFEGRVQRPNGPRSWYMESLGAPPTEVLVRTVETNVAFPVGMRVRLLGVRRSQDPDDAERLVISMTNTSEWYPVSS
jgi:hypothetical protein